MNLKFRSRLLVASFFNFFTVLLQLVGCCWVLGLLDGLLHLIKLPSNLYIVNMDIMNAVKCFSLTSVCKEYYRLISNTGYNEGIFVLDVTSF